MMNTIMAMPTTTDYDGDGHDEHERTNFDGPVACYARHNSS
jgi:hypothetical protein